MKKLIVTLSLLLTTTSVCFAGKNEVLDDISKLAKATNIQNFIEQNQLLIMSITYKLTAYCAGGPSNFVISALKNNGTTCEVWVQVGDCVGDKSREKVTLLTDLQNIKCH